MGGEGRAMQCSGIRSADGKRCRGEALPGSEFCYSHNPLYKEELRRAGARGGRIAGKGRPKASSRVIDEVIDEVDSAVRDARSGEHKGMAAVAQLLQTKLKAVELRLKVVEHETWSEKLAEIEERQEAWTREQHGSA